jgi:hypothetical protein
MLISSAIIPITTSGSTNVNPIVFRDRMRTPSMTRRRAKILSASESKLLPKCRETFSRRGDLPDEVRKSPTLPHVPRRHASSCASRWDTYPRRTRGSAFRWIKFPASCVSVWDVWTPHRSLAKAVERGEARTSFQRESAKGLGVFVTENNRHLLKTRLTCHLLANLAISSLEHIEMRELFGGSPCLF